MIQSIDRIGMLWATALIGALAYAQPSNAEGMLAAPSAERPSLQMVVNEQGQAARPPDQNGAARARPDRIEERISDLHSKLHISPDQETEWKTVAQVMRTNAKEIRAAGEERSENQQKMSAVDDLRAYRKHAQAHVYGLDRLIPAFEALYAKMSDDQKKNADVVFSGHPAQHGSN